MNWLRRWELAVKGSVSTGINIMVTTVIVGIACRVRWDMSGPEERVALLPGGPNDLALWAVVTWAVVFLMVKETFRLLARIQTEDRA